ncbi:hypothetical protein IWX90DRAFT_53435 [Phyllosticta citrichinensis]|uniref:Uncharacterized protein n=1 Tax=Phyllosticta citrichinensis TaxID=1130410 RepID=A0ABR1XIG8_9PEZI
MSINVKKGYFVKVRRGWVPVDSKRGQRHIRRKCPRERSGPDVAVLDNISVASLDEIIKHAYKRMTPPWSALLKRIRSHPKRSSPDATVQADERTEPPADARRVFGSSDLTSAAPTDTRDRHAKIPRTLSPISEATSEATSMSPLHETGKPKQQRQDPVCTCKHHHHRKQGENQQSRHHRHNHGNHHCSKHSAKHGSQHHHHCHHYDHPHHEQRNQRQHSHTPCTRPRHSAPSNSPSRLPSPFLHPEDAHRSDRRRQNKSDPKHEHRQKSTRAQIPTVTVSVPMTPRHSPSHSPNAQNNFPQNRGHPYMYSSRNSTQQSFKTARTLSTRPSFGSMRSIPSMYGGGGGGGGMVGMGGFGLM